MQQNISEKAVNSMPMSDSDKATLQVFLTDRDDVMRVAFLDGDGNIYIRAVSLNQALKDMLAVFKEKVKRAIEADKKAGKVRYHKQEEELKIKQTIH